MRLATAIDPANADLEGAVGEVLERRLLSGSPRPVAVALSGGGDSLALSLIAADWARRAGRRLLILSVDHRLRAESASWTEACAATATKPAEGSRSTSSAASAA